MAVVDKDLYPVGVRGTPGSTWSAIGAGFSEAVSDPDDPLGDENTYIRSQSDDTNFTGAAGRIEFAMSDASSWGDPPWVWDRTQTMTLSIRYRTRNVFGGSAPDVDIWLKNPSGGGSIQNRVHIIREAWAPDSGGSWATAQFTFRVVDFDDGGTSDPSSMFDMWDLGIELSRQGSSNTQLTLEITWMELTIPYHDTVPNDQWGTGRVHGLVAGSDPTTFDTWVPSSDNLYETIDDQRPADDDTSYLVFRNDSTSTTLTHESELTGTEGSEEWLLVRWQKNTVPPSFIGISLRDKASSYANIFPREDGDHFYVFKAAAAVNVNATTWYETWVKLSNADKSGGGNNTVCRIRSVSPTPDIGDTRVTQVIFTTTGTNNQTVTPSPAGASFVATTPQVKADGDGSDDDGGQDPPGIDYDPPRWIKADPSLNAETQTGHLDLVGFDDVINRPPKWIWGALQRLHDDLYRERELIGSSAARFGMPVEGQVLFSGESSVTGTQADHPIATTVAGGAVATGYQGKVYVVGPQTGSGFAYHYVYDPSDNSWDPLAPVPDAAPGNGFYCTIGDTLHFLSTEGATGKTRHYAYNPTTDAWDTSQFAPMPTPRVRFAASLASGRIYIMGGLVVPAATDIPSSVVECWSSVSGNWERVADLPWGTRGDMKASTWGQWVYAFGGWGNSGEYNAAEPVATAAKYDTALDRWTTLPDIAHGSITSYERRAPMVFTINDKIYVCGGVPVGSASALSTVSVFDPVTETWDDGPAMPRANSGAAFCTAAGSGWVIRGVSGGTRYKTTDRLMAAVPAYVSTATHLVGAAFVEGDADETNAILNVTSGVTGECVAADPGDEIAIRAADADVDWNTTLTARATLIGKGGRVD